MAKGFLPVGSLPCADSFHCCDDVSSSMDFPSLFLEIVFCASWVTLCMSSPMLMSWNTSLWELCCFQFYIELCGPFWVVSCAFWTPRYPRTNVKGLALSSVFLIPLIIQVVVVFGYFWTLYFITVLYGSVPVGCCFCHRSSQHSLGSCDSFSTFPLLCVVLTFVFPYEI